MLTPTSARIVHFSHPISNTPAACLTQFLPPGIKGKVLLLECADIRHILFTNHLDGERPLDVTLCDDDALVVARNVMLLSLILDDVDDQHSKDNFNIFYHLFLTPDSMDRLRLQTHKLLAYSESLAAWEASEYGPVFSFCDTGTLRRVREVWEFWSSNYRPAFLNAWVEGHSLSTQRPSCSILNSTQAVAPYRLDDVRASNDMVMQFWQKGKLEEDPTANVENPMFSSPDESLVMSTTSHPLFDFHLCISAAQDSQADYTPDEDQFIVSAREEFRSWSLSLRRRPRGPPAGLKIRFFSGDSLAFCQILRVYYGSGFFDISSVALYRSRRELVPLDLDGESRGPQGSAPGTFNVIDTFNLINSVGPYNLFTAVSPLLDYNTYSTLHAQLLVRPELRPHKLAGDLLLGNSATLSFLFSLMPVDLWTNTSPSPSVDMADRDLMEEMNRSNSPGNPLPRQLSQIKLLWKRPFFADHRQNSPPLWKGPHAHMLNFIDKLYEDMFRPREANSDPGELVLGGEEAATFIARPRYHHCLSFVGVLRHLMKSTHEMDWMGIISGAMSTITDHPALPQESKDSECETLVHMHLLGVYATLLHDIRLNCVWKQMPAIISLTLVVGRDRLEVFTSEKARRRGELLLQCSLHYREAHPGGWKSIFTGLHMGYGHLFTEGERNTDNFQVNVKTDPRGIRGSMPLIVAFLVPATMMTDHRSPVSVALSLQPSPANYELFGNELDQDLDIFRTVISDHESVYLSRALPNTPHQVYERPRFFGPQNYLFHDNHGRSSLETVSRFGETITLRYYKYVLEGNQRLLFFNFPRGPDQEHLSVYSTMKLPYSVLDLPVYKWADPTSRPFKWLTYPVCTDEHLADPVAWNLPYVDLSRLITVSPAGGSDWLLRHTSRARSSRERRPDPVTWRTMNKTVMAMSRARVHPRAKALISELFDLRIKRHSQMPLVVVLGSCPKRPDIFIFVRAVRLDLANRTVILDSAVLPMTAELWNGTFASITRPGSETYLYGTGNGNVIRRCMDEEDVKHWRAMLPAFVERCRTWTHRLECRYREYWMVPISVVRGQKVLCDCGNGSLDVDEFGKPDVPMWEDMAKYAVRAAISPPFFSTLVEEE